MDEETPRRIGLSDMDTTKYMTFGSLFILAVDTSLFPLDTLKTIIMSDRIKKSKGNVSPRPSVIRLAWNIAKREGVLRFWRGVVPSTLGNFPGQASYYLALESAQEAMATVLPNGESKIMTFTRGFVSGTGLLIKGMAAEVAGGIFYVPADIVAQRLQIQSIQGFVHNSRLYNGPLDVVQKVLKSDGPLGLYRGYAAYVTAYAPGSAVQWGSYEVSKGYSMYKFKKLVYRILTLLEKQEHIPDRIPLKEQYVNAFSAGMLFLIPAFSSVCAITSNNPLEILRIRTQLLESKSKKDAEAIKGGYFQLAKTILREEGWTAFYRGLKIRLIVTVPSAIGM